MNEHEILPPFGRLYDKLCYDYQSMIEVSGCLGMVPSPTLFVASACITLLCLIPLAVAGKAKKSNS